MVSTRMFAHKYHVCHDSAHMSAYNCTTQGYSLRFENVVSCNFQRNPVKLNIYYDTYLVVHGLRPTFGPVVPCSLCLSCVQCTGSVISIKLCSLYLFACNNCPIYRAF